MNTIGRNRFRATLTKGIISAWKKTVNGWPVLQMDAGINHGNSVGRFATKWEVIGISTFGSLDDNTRGLAAGLNFAIPLIVAREFFSDSVAPRASQVSIYFCKALTSYQKQHYKEALRYFKKVNPPMHRIPDCNLL
jgi:S1-C subfamily serine protease